MNSKVYMRLSLHLFFKKLNSLGSFWMQWIGNFSTRFVLYMKKAKFEKWKCMIIYAHFKAFSLTCSCLDFVMCCFYLFILLKLNTHQVEMIWESFVNILKSCNLKMLRIMIPYFKGGGYTLKLIEYQVYIRLPQHLF